MNTVAREFNLIALTFPALLDPSIAIAASRAGELGVLSLEYIEDSEAACQAVAKLDRYAKNSYGLKLSCQQSKLLADLPVYSLSHLRFVLLTGHDPRLLEQQIEAIHQCNLQVFLEITSLEQARTGKKLGVDAVVAKGNEAGGYVGEQTTFVLLQECLTQISLPVYAQGGIGLHTAAACYAAGANGVVLDTQLALTHESRLPTSIKDRVAAMDGSETICLGDALGERYRVYHRPGQGLVESLRREEAALAANAEVQIDDKRAAWRDIFRQRIGWTDPDRQILLLGQDAAFAAPFARRFATVSGVLAAVRHSLDAHCKAAFRLRPLDQGTPLARSHRTRYPIVQGPMTRVSDKAAFALKVAQAGGLPFLALGLMRKADVMSLLEETRQELGEYPWGVGILGFATPTVRQEQLEAIRAVRPTFALIAGGRPDQASLLEREGIPTYLHVPSPGLLKMFLANGTKRFIFEGYECGGHIGPRSSFVLWETAIEILLEYLGSTKEDAGNFHILFAGGIHDALSSSAVATLVAPLADLGVCVGVLMGTAYIFTQEAVATEAIVPGYQEEALRGNQTIVLETGPGHAIRCLPTSYACAFNEHKLRFLQDGIAADQMHNELEALNVGRLRAATKGTMRHPQYGQNAQVPKYITLDAKEQREQGLYMIGQVVALRNQVCTVTSLHHQISVEGSARLEALRDKALDLSDSQPATTHSSQVAIVGMACILPRAPNLQSYWENVLARVDAVIQVPRDRWNWERYFSPDITAKDKTYSKWGGFIDDIPFNPLDYGIPPSSLPSIEPMQLLMLEVVRAGLADAGYLERPFPRERTSVIVGVGGGLGDLGYMYGFRSYLAHFLDAGSSQVISNLADVLPEWTEDSFPGILLSVVAGRVANRFNLGGPNFVVDAACGSSLAALDIAIKDLETHRTDMAIVGAVDTVQSPFGFLAFSSTRALSPSGRCRPFDAEADGIVISEGLAVVILKRLEDAERDGDRVYAVIRGVGASSDGKGMGLTAPRPVGQLRALRRAYARAGFSPATVSLIEAHGTGTQVGDVAEVEALEALYQGSQASPQSCALGSVKSMIGHTKSTAGLAGLIKTAMALYHKVLPPTLIDQLNPKFISSASPFYVNSEARPWLMEGNDQVRRAGVSAFGFGGTNFHAVLEEYRDGYLPAQASLQTWPAELLIWRSQGRTALLNALDELEDWLSAGNEPPLRDLAFSLSLNDQQPVEAHPAREPDGVILAIVATSLDDLREKLAQAKTKLSGGDATINDPRGVYFAVQSLHLSGGKGKIAFLFPGQGAQYPNMLRDLALQFPQVRACFEFANHVLRDRLPAPLSNYIFPIPAYTQEAIQAGRQALTATHIAQPALGVAGLAVSSLLKEMGIRPDAVAGHSYGEIVALCEARVISPSDLLNISEARGRFMTEAAGPESGTMAAVRAGQDTVAAAIQGIDNLMLANLNSPVQTVISGSRASVTQAVKLFESQGITARSLPVACAFHSPLVAPASVRLAEFLEAVKFSIPEIDVFSNSTAGPYPREPETIREMLSGHIIRSVEFQREIEAMYAAGVRIFIETGPHSILSGLVDQILGDKSYLAVSIDQQGEPGLVTLQKALGQLAALGVSLHLEPLYDGRKVTQVDFHRAYVDPDRAKFGPMTWLVNGGRARPWRDFENNVPEPTTLPLKVESPDANLSITGASSTDGGRTSQPIGPVLSIVTPQSGAWSEHENGIGDGTSRIMLQHQRLMARFLETQKNIMLAYLGGMPDGFHELPAAFSQGPERQELMHASAVSPSDQPVVSALPPSAEIGTGFPSRTVPSEAHELSLDVEALTRKLLMLVSERTGYPPEILELDANLESDLGIDSIKRVEILGEFCREHPELETVLSGEGMERLGAQRTLRAIVDWIGSQIQDAVPILRFELVPVEASLNGQAAPLAAGRAILITNDGLGIGEAVADTLRSQGHRAILVTDGQEVTRTGPYSFTVDLTRIESVGVLLHMVRQENGPIGSLLHLAPLGDCQDFESMDLGDWQDCLRHRLGGLFYLVRHLYEDLDSSSQNGGSCLLVATNMGGVFACNDDNQGSKFFPGQGGLGGLLKTLAHEWPNVRIKTVDLNLRQESSFAVQAILQELTAGDDLVEVGYDGTLRRMLQVVPSPLDKMAPLPLVIDGESVILVTGGARGITAQVAHELAVHYKPTLLLVGRSPLPAPAESAQTAGLASQKAIKNALIASLSQKGQRASLAQVETAYVQLLREREMRANLTAMRQAGATVRYFQADVRDETTFGALIDDIYHTYGRLDGVIHGAGVIEDKLIKDKTPESFERVFSTKVDSAFILSRKLRSDTLRFLVFFTSVSGRFGNRGQGDYAAANEVLNKLAIYLDRRWPGRVVSINWGPWDAPGMVSAEVRKQFAQRGISLIPVAIGRKKLLEEIAFGHKGEAEVLVCGQDTQVMAGR